MSSFYLLKDVMMALQKSLPQVCFCSTSEGGTCHDLSFIFDHMKLKPAFVTTNTRYLFD